ncbi:MAG: four-helix bundle copper-binding protein, partial [Mycetocola sp.]
MNMAMQMMESHQKDMPVQGMDMTMMQECIEACSACEQACTMCSST